MTDAWNDHGVIARNHLSGWLDSGKSAVSGTEKILNVGLFSAACRHRCVRALSFLHRNYLWRSSCERPTRCMSRYPHDHSHHYRSVCRASICNPRGRSFGGQRRFERTLEKAVLARIRRRRRYVGTTENSATSLDTAHLARGTVRILKRVDKRCRETQWGFSNRCRVWLA